MPEFEVAPIAPALTPISATERISSMDVLRGTALLGIALMNIVFSALPLSAYFNPNVAGGKTGANLAALALQYVFFDGKMRGIFSLMFGAGSYYFITRGDRRGAGIQAISLYYRRVLWLMLFGLVHAYLIWHGDILYPYALLGLLLFPLQGLRPRTLLIAAAALLTVQTSLTIARGFHTREIYNLAMEAEKAEAAHNPVTDKQKEAKTSWEEMRKEFYPADNDLKKEREMYLGSYLNLVGKRAAVVIKWHSEAFYMQGWDMLIMMLVGLAFAKTNLLTAECPWHLYRMMAIVGIGLGLAISSITMWLMVSNGFNPIQNSYLWFTYQPARVFTTIGYTAAILMICKAGLLKHFTSRVASVGQMAFSNYIAHSLIYGFVFYGYGLALFGKLQRFQIYGVVLGMWAFSLLISPVWMRHYRYGPLEWCWRSLTYWKKQPMGIAPAVSEEAVGQAIRLSPSEQSYTNPG